MAVMKTNASVVTTFVVATPLSISRAVNSLLATKVLEVICIMFIVNGKISKS